MLNAAFGVNCSSKRLSSHTQRKGWMSANIAEKANILSQRIPLLFLSITRNPLKMSSSPNPAAMVTLAKRIVIEDCSSLIPRKFSPKVSKITMSTAPKMPMYIHRALAGVAPGSAALEVFPALQAFRSVSHK